MSEFFDLLSKGVKGQLFTCLTFMDDSCVSTCDKILMQLSRTHTRIMLKHALGSIHTCDLLAMNDWLNYSLSNTVEEEHGILTYNGRMFSLPHFHFQFKSVNISTILTSKPKKRCVNVWRLVSWLSLEIYISWVESSVNKQFHLNCVLFLHRVNKGCVPY